MTPVSATHGTLAAWSPVYWLLRRIGLWDVDRSGGRVSYRFTWGEFAPGLSFHVGYCIHDDGATWYVPLIVGQLYVKARRLVKFEWGTEDGGFGWNYGVHLTREAIHLNWRSRAKVLWWPWNLDWCSRELLTFDGQVVAVERKGGPPLWRIQEPGSYERWKELCASISETLAYRYVLRSGEVQERQATVYVDRMTWRRRCFPFLRQVRTCINVSFDGEVGERTGSWKGGVTGTGYELQPDETPRECLRRMERDHRFD